MYELTCAVRGGKYSNDHHILSSLVAVSIFLLIFMTSEYVKIKYQVYGIKEIVSGRECASEQMLDNEQNLSRSIFSF